MNHHFPGLGMDNIGGNANFGSQRSIGDVAKELRVHRTDISRILSLAFLSPKMVDAIMAGSQPTDLTPSKLVRAIDLPTDWKRRLSSSACEGRARTFLSGTSPSHGLNLAPSADDRRDASTIGTEIGWTPKSRT
jgi:hypothetical protein